MMCKLLIQFLRATTFNTVLPAAIFVSQTSIPTVIPLKMTPVFNMLKRYKTVVNIPTVYFKPGKLEKITKEQAENHFLTKQEINKKHGFRDGE